MPPEFHVTALPRRLILLCAAAAAGCASEPPASPPPAPVIIVAAPAPAPVAATPAPPLPSPQPPPPAPAVVLLDEADRLRALSVPDLAQEISRLGAADGTPQRQVLLAIALAQTRVPSDLQRAQGLLARVLENGGDDARTLHPLARLLAAQYNEQRRADDAAERQTQQLRDAQRRIDQLNDRLEAMRAVERSLSTRPNGAASAPRVPTP